MLDHNSNTSKACKAWEKDLILTLTPEDWETIFLNIHKGSINVSTQENRYKIQPRWYRTPALLHKFKPTIPDTCWRCQEDRGTLIHIWWLCPRIQTFWKEVHLITSHITTYEIAFTPAQFLLHHSPTRQNSYHYSLMMQLINAAKQCVPIHGKSQTAPSIKKWFHRINRTADMKELIHVARDTPNKFVIKWAC